MSNKLNRRLQQLLKEMEPSVARAFQEAVRNIVSNAKLSRIIAAIERGDVEGAVRAMDLDRAVFAAVQSAMGAAYTQSGALVVAGTAWRNAQANRIQVYWNASNPRAERWLAEVAGQLITELTKEAAEVVRDTIRAGYATGAGPRKIGLDLVGRIDSTGRRSGGAIGLSRPQSNAVLRAQADLSGSKITIYENGISREYQGTTAKYMDRVKRDKRFDSTILKAKREGRSLTDAEIDKITGRYSDRLLKLRGDTIARTETAQAVEAARQEAFEQWRDKTGISDQFIIRRWDHAGGGKSSRDWHYEMNGWTVQGLTTPFVTPRGAALMYPCDTSLGAGAAEVVNCRCMQTIQIDYKAMANG